MIANSLGRSPTKLHSDWSAENELFPVGDWDAYLGHIVKDNYQAARRLPFMRPQTVDLLVSLVLCASSSRSRSSGGTEPLDQFDARESLPRHRRRWRYLSRGVDADRKRLALCRSKPARWAQRVQRIRSRF